VTVCEESGRSFPLTGSGEETLLVKSPSPIQAVTPTQLAMAPDGRRPYLLSTPGIHRLRLGS